MKIVVNKSSRKPFRLSKEGLRFFLSRKGITPHFYVRSYGKEIVYKCMENEFNRMTEVLTVDLGKRPIPYLYREAINKGQVFKEESIMRDDPDLVYTVEYLGRKAADVGVSLHIIEIPDDVDWMIVESDNGEYVAEKHRVWH